MYEVINTFRKHSEEILGIIILRFCKANNVDCIHLHNIIMRLERKIINRIESVSFINL